MKVVDVSFTSNGISTTYLDKDGNLIQHQHSVEDMDKYFSGNPNKNK